MELNVRTLLGKTALALGLAAAAPANAALVFLAGETFFIGVRTAVAVPEPVSHAMFGTALLGQGMVRRKRHKAV
jgi:hypothetical protein